MSLIQWLFRVLFGTIHRHHKHKEHDLMAALSDLNTAVANVVTAKNNVVTAANALIASVASPIPQAVIDSLNGVSTDLGTLKDQIVAATPPPS